MSWNEELTALAAKTDERLSQARRRHEEALKEAAERITEQIKQTRSRIDEGLQQRLEEQKRSYRLAEQERMRFWQARMEDWRGKSLETVARKILQSMMENAP